VEGLELKVFTMEKCPKCPLAKEIARRVAEKFGLRLVEVRLDTPDGEIEGLMYNVVSTPSIALGDEVLVRGDVLPEETLEREVRRRLMGAEA